MNKDYISFKSVAADIYSHPKMKDMPFEMIVTYTKELMGVTGCPVIFVDMEEVLEIREHRAMLPCNFYELRQMRLERPSACVPGRSPMRLYERTEHSIFNNGDDEEAKTVTRQIGVQQVAVVPQHRIPLSPMFKEETGTFMDANSHPGADFTYKIQGNVVITSIPDGKVRIAYRAIGMDEEGWPLIIDNDSFIRALKSYIKMQWFTQKFECDELGKNGNAILQNVQQDYYANIAQAESRLQDLGPEKMRNIANILTDMMPRKYEHASGYTDLNKEHSLRVH